jgi:predicted transcriptional regulator
MVRNQKSICNNTKSVHKGYSIISIRKILEVGLFFKINTKISEIPAKNIVTFQKNDTVRQAIQRMFDNNS